jgi:hypothetical protein
MQVQKATIYNTTSTNNENNNINREQNKKIIHVLQKKKFKPNQNKNTTIEDHATLLRPVLSIFFATTSRQLLRGQFWIEQRATPDCAFKFWHRLTAVSRLKLSKVGRNGPLLILKKIKNG